MGAQMGERPADRLTATGYLLEYRVGRTDVGCGFVTHLNFDNKINCTTRCQGSNVLMPSGCCPVTRRGAVWVIRCDAIYFSD